MIADRKYTNGPNRISELCTVMLEKVKVESRPTGLQVEHRVLSDTEKCAEVWVKLLGVPSLRDRNIHPSILSCLWFLQ